jgi:hypothetical protein
VGGGRWMKEVLLVQGVYREAATPPQRLNYYD